VKLEPSIDVPASVYFCQVCQIGVEGVPNVQNHKAVHARTHKQLLAITPMYNCGSCRSIFLTISALDHHLTHECRPIDYCNLVPSSTEPLAPDDCSNDPAMFASVKLENKLYSCDHCTTFHDLSLETVVNHSTNDHLLTDGSTGAPHTCGICFEVFSTAMATRIHILLHSTCLSCASCDFKCEKMKQLIDHEVTGHFATDDRTCRHCGDQIAVGVTEEQHDLQCSERRFQCVNCDKRFLKRCTLKIHERIHGGKRLECDICGRRFKQTSDLKNHQRLHDVYRPYKCEICGKQFQLSSHLGDHMVTHSSVIESQVRF
jgi:Zinc finger, C2H2 type